MRAPGSLPTKEFDELLDVPCMVRADRRTCSDLTIKPRHPVHPDESMLRPLLDDPYDGPGGRQSGCIARRQQADIHLDLGDGATGRRSAL